MVVLKTLTLTRQLLWNVVPVATTTTFLEPLFLQSLETAVMDSYTHFLSTTSSTTKTSRNKRRNTRVRKSRTPIVNPNELTAVTTATTDGGGAVTNNDVYFEYQRINGYRLKPLHFDGIAEEENEAFTICKSQLLPHVSTLYLNELSTKIVSSLDGLLTCDMWATVQRGKGAFHPNHIHDGAFASGVLYVKLPMGSAPLLFKKPTELDSISNNYTLEEQEGWEQINEDTVVFYPKEGQIILFPPWLYHGVPIADNHNANNNDARISFAFNVTGPFGGGNPFDVTRMYLDS